MSLENEDQNLLDQPTNHEKYKNQSRRSWQGPEHDELLGNGSFPRPHGYEPGLSAPKFRANGNNQLNRANEPYQHSCPYKAPRSRRDTHDNYNDETFGSSAECAYEDRAKEERKRRGDYSFLADIAAGAAFFLVLRFYDLFFTSLLRSVVKFMLHKFKFNG
ncbi:unnamed protein product [Lupinus luteus]|uniref:Uncharacterized protein n=1 Tax=Lupinus luteus TaxID=3873 RepID=A0AAV1WGK6_LUPLU